MSSVYDFRDKPIPDLSELRRNKLEYRTYPINPQDESCVRLNGELKCRSHYWYYNPRPVGALEEIYVRGTLASKLYGMSLRLKPLRLGLLIKEGFRPLSVQEFVGKVSVLNRLKQEFPQLDPIELQDKVRKFAAPADVDVRVSPPPHFTGGAVDLTLFHTESGEEVDMGKNGGLFATAYPDALESAPGFRSEKEYRRLLYWLAQEEGLVTNPDEWWHLCFGDQMWAWVNKAPSAFYGVAEIPNR